VDKNNSGFTGETLAKDGAPPFENVPVAGNIAAIPGRNGYWVINHNGEIFARGDAPQLCDGRLRNCGGFPEYPTAFRAIVAAAATPTGLGLWAVGRDGKLWTAGDAQAYGDVQNETAVDLPSFPPELAIDPLVPTGIAATPSGKG
jgi:hypothetical protein